MLEENKGGFNTPFASPRLLGQLRIWGNCKEQPQWLLLICAASTLFRSPECFGRQYSLTSPLQSPSSLSAFSIASSMWKAIGCRRIALLNQCSAVREISSWYCYFLMEKSTGFALLSWKSYCLLQSRIDVMFSWRSKIIWVYISDVDCSFERFFCFLNVESI